MTHQELINQLHADLLSKRDGMILSQWQSTASAAHEYDKERFVFCEIILANESGGRSIIRISSRNIKAEMIPPDLEINILYIRFRNPGYPNMPSFNVEYKNIFKGQLADPATNEFSYSLLLALLKNSPLQSGI